MKQFRISLVQTELFWEDPERNLRFFERITEPLKGKTDLILFPEMFTTGFTMEPEKYYEDPEGRTYHYLRDLAQSLGAAVAGSCIIRENDRYYNRFLFATPAGDILHYDKRHLFRMGEEHLHYHAGNRQVRIDHAGIRIKPFICYDLRFPVWVRSRNDADLLLFVANWPASRRKVWESLLIARALENQVYVAGVNRVGRDGRGIDYSGDSFVISPRGGIMGSLEAGKEGVITAVLDMAEQKAFREKFPVHLDGDDFQIRL